METTELEPGRIYRLEDDIYVMNFRDEFVVEQKHMAELFEAFEKMTAGVPQKILVLSGHNGTATSEAREYAQNHPMKFLAEAIVVQSLAQRIIVNFYMSFKNTAHPIKLFTDRRTAIEWLNEI